MKVKRPQIIQLTAILFVLAYFVPQQVSGQLGIPLSIKKPQEYEERPLRSERSDEKKFNLPRRFIQNTVTHYNYYFNANNKLNEVLERAKETFKDDYSLLLPFYNYSLDVTAGDSIQLDSITYKSSTGIALHDLRNDWVDNLYLLWGASYYLKKEFDSAYLMFQFINYAFAPKEKDGYYLNIGSKRDGNSALSIATKEKNSLPRKIFTEPPSRNDAFIWQIRNFLAQDQLAEAASLIVTLKNDPLFPKRLQNDLHEVQAYWFYKQGMWDSCANHLVDALGNATNKQEMARWEYLAAQLYELSGKYKDAVHYYAKVSAHTTDPILDIYARLYAIRANKDDGEKDIAKNVAELLKMAKRDKYSDYQDIIYYMAAQMQLDGKNYDQALALLLKSTQFASNNPSQRNKAFLQMGDISFNRQEFRHAANYYDSMKLDDTTIHNPEAIRARRATAAGLADNIEIIYRQDSLQRIAAMPEEDRKDFVKKLAKTLRKEQGLKEEAYVNTGSSLLPPITNPVIPNLFSAGDNTKGEWYFYNNSFRNKGLNDFHARWGNRPNVDNWRRIAAVGSGNFNNNPNIAGDQTKGNQTGTTPAEEISFDALYDKLPLKEEDLKKSNDSIQNALFKLGKLYLQELEDCSSSTQRLEELRTRFASFEPMDEVLFNLYYCYNKNGETAKAAACKKALSDKYATGRFATIVNTGKDPEMKSGKSDATQAYERIYDLFIEGKFAEAEAAKKTADQVYGKSFWTPQLLYIEAVYYIKTRQDSTAKAVLTDLIGQFATHPLAGKAATLLNVLNRRAEIEAELSNMVVNRNVGDTVVKKPVTQPVVINNQPKPDSVKVVTQPVVTQPVNPVNNPPKNVSSPYTNNPAIPHYVVLLLNKVDPVFVNEARNAFNRYNQDTYYGKTFSSELFPLDADNRLLLITPFANAQEAINYIDKAKPVTSTEILPWLKGGKYSFLILTESNYEILQSNKDIDNYKAFLNQQYPGKF